MPFLEFVEHHPIGTSVNGIVETYSSHGAYIAIGNDGVRGYIPLRLMADPAPTSARKVMQIGEAVTVVVVSFAAARRSIDCALPDMAGHAQATVAPEEDAPARPSRRGRSKSETRVAEAVIDQLGNAPVDRPCDAASAPTEPAPKRASRKRAAPPRLLPSARRSDAPSDRVERPGDAAKPTPAKAAPAKAAGDEGPGEAGAGEEGGGDARRPPRRLRPRRWQRRRRPRATEGGGQEVTAASRRTETPARSHGRSEEGRSEQDAGGQEGAGEAGASQEGRREEDLPPPSRPPRRRRQGSTS